MLLAVATPSGDADLSRQCPARSAPTRAAGQRPRQGPQREPARASCWSCTRSASTAATRQADVQELARILTGWSVARSDRRGRRRPLPLPRRACTSPATRRCSAGATTRAARRKARRRSPRSRAIRRPPATSPPSSPPLRRRRAAGRRGRSPGRASIRDSDGDLAAAARAPLIAPPEAWATPLAKVKSTQDFVDLGAARDRRRSAAPRAGRRAARSSARRRSRRRRRPAGPTPPRTGSRPEALMRRLEWGMPGWPGGSTRRCRRRRWPRRRIGPVATPDTLRADRAARRPPDGIALLFASPEFQRR